MYKLLSAEFVRLWKSFVFKLALVFSAGLGIFCILMRWFSVKEDPKLYAQLGIEYCNADALIFTGGLYLIFAMAIFIGIFVGTEYSDGTIRNKLTAGHTRSSIYLSKLFICIAADIIMHILFILVVLGLGNLLIGGTTMKTVEILKFTGASTAAVISFTAVLLLISMSIQSKAAGAVICLLMALIMELSAITIYNRLEAPEYYEAYSWVDEETGNVITEEEEKNPQYLSGTKRKVFEFLNDFLPVSQIYQIGMHISDNLGRMVFYDGVCLAVATSAGIVIFRKKNLK